jgi:hypothetical protein
MLPYSRIHRRATLRLRRFGREGPKSSRIALLYLGEGAWPVELSALAACSAQSKSDFR